jgi:hypothetical protein
MDPSQQASKATDNAFIEAMGRASVGVKVILGKDNDAT